MVNETGRDPVQQLILDELKTLREEQRRGFHDLRTEVNTRIDQKVSVESFMAEQRRNDERAAALGSDIVAERDSRKEQEKKAQDRSDRLATNVRWLAASVVVPIALFVANMVVARG